MHLKKPLLCCHRIVHAPPQYAHIAGRLGINKIHGKQVFINPITKKKINHTFIAFSLYNNILYGIRGYLSVCGNFFFFEEKPQCSI